MDSIDRQVREAAHGPDHQLMQSIWRSIVSDTTTGSGYAYLDEEGAGGAAGGDQPAYGAAAAVGGAADGGAEQTIGHVTVANEWAVDIGMAARLDLHTSGYLALRGMKPPSPYVHNGALL